MNFCIKTSYCALVFLFSQCIHANPTMFSDVINPNSNQELSQNDWRNSSLSMDKFIDDLLEKMTLDEKIGQLDLQSGYRGVTGPFVNAAYEQQIRNGNVGAIFNAYGAEFGKRLQTIAVEQTRLGIPIIMGHDVIHGHKTIFPQSIGEAASWDLEAIRLSAKIAAKEASADGIMWTFAPVADIVRDPRWGRVSESVGEDPLLTSAISVARVKGFQGEDISLDDTIMATAKHFVGYGASQAGRDYNSTDISEHSLWSLYLPPFKAMLDAGVTTFMTGFNDLNGMPVTGNRYLLEDVLRDKWGFKGFVVTDYTAVNELVAHGYAKDEKHAAQLAFNGGADMDMVGQTYLKYLKLLIEERKVSEARLNGAVRRILEMKWRLGLFADPYRYHDDKRAAQRILTKENLAAANDMARRSMVLLKNHNQTLPIDTKKINSIALIGPLADNRYDMIGNWAGAGDRGTQPVTVKEGLESILGEDVTIRYAKGATHSYLLSHTGMSSLMEIDVPVSGQTVQDLQTEIDEALKIAKESDVVVMVLGEDQRMSGEASSRTELSLPGNQQVLMEALHSLNKPLILVVMSGRPNDLRWADSNVDAILHAWYPGTMGGQAVADVLLGKYNPAGKLPMTFPRSVGQVPLFYNHKNTGRPIGSANPAHMPAEYTSRYDDSLNSPLYAFGHGLSYTQFEYSPPILSSEKLTPKGELTITVKVTNIGDRKGEEVIQLYTHQKVGSITRPIKELKGFQKLEFAPGETKNVKFTLTPADLAFFRADMTWGTEPGEFDVMVGGASNQVQTLAFTLTD
ncbi:beta-glucosidase BglX [uncultured Paraglaciecola sp.]|uniref:beta-glucosidase BglX n=1 Tax=uncultured Paraglaciecola sp. TaxID=1765024 RepID=UPI0025978376|nr:beta-glucosidase BglX [uncultured Paraglaciecola sp.]